MKRKLSVFAACLLAASIAGCGNSPGAAPSSAGSAAPSASNPASAQPSSSAASVAAEPAASGDDWFPTENISLRWSFWASNEEWPYWGAGIDRYKELHPNVEFVIETTPWSEYWNKLSTQVASQSQPDITGMTTGTSRVYLANGSLLDLTDYMERDSKDPDSGWNTDNYWEGVFWGYTLNDRIYGVPYDMGPTAICLNVDLFEELGVPLPEEGWTFDDMIEIAKKLTVDRDGDGVTDVYGMAWTPEDSNFYDNFVLSLGSRMVLGEEPNQTFELSPMTAPCIQKIADGLREGWNYNQTQAQDLGLFQSGQVAMISANPEWFGKYAKLMENPNLYAMEAPMTGDKQYDTGAKYIGGGGFSIGSNTEYPDVCWDFLKNYLNEEGVRTTTAIPFRGIPPHKTLMNDFLNSEFAPKNAQAIIKFMAEERDNVFFTCPNWNTIRDTIASEMEAVYAGAKSAEDACAYITEEANRLIRMPE